MITDPPSNAAADAPSSPVRIIAADRADQVLIEIRDFGPGAAPGRVRAVFGSGVCDDTAGGTRLGPAVFPAGTWSAS